MLSLLRRPALLDTTTAAAVPAFGHATACPECEGTSYVELVDFERRAMHQRCVRCGLLFVITDAQISLASTPI